MSNMSYCRFRNTLGDLRDCRDALEEIGGDLSELSADEQKAATALIKLCLTISDAFGEPPDDGE